MKKYLNLLIITLLIIFSYSACKNDSTPAATDSTPTPDTGGPVITFVNPVQDGVVSGTIQIAGTAEDASDIDAVNLQIDGIPITDPENIVITGHYFNYAVDTFVDLTEEAHTATAQAADVSGNTGEAVTLDFVVNHEFPAIQVNNPAHGALVRGAAVIVDGTASTTAPASIFSIKVDPDGNGTDFTYFTTVYTSPSWNGQFDSTVLADGDYTVAVVASADNGNSAIVNVSITSDNSQPTVAITSHSDGQAVSLTTVILEGTAGDNVEVDKVEIELNNSGTQELAQGTSNWQYTINNLLVDQPNILIATATDTAGNIQTQQITLYQDSSPAVITVTTAPAEGSYNKKIINLSGTVTNLNVAGDTMEIKINSYPFINVSSFDPTFSPNWSHPIDTIGNGIPDGALAITLRATKTSTSSTTTHTINCYLDNTDPAGTITSPAENAQVSGQVVITGTADDAIAMAATNGVYILIVDDDNSGTVNEEADITASLSAGQWSYLWNTTGYIEDCTITVTLTDKAGNDTVITRSVLQSNTAPSVTASVQDPESDGSSIVHGLLTISGSATDTLGTTPGVESVELWFDSPVPLYPLTATDFTGNTLPYTGTDTWSYSYDSAVLAEGSHDLHVKVTDQDGGSSEAILTIEADNIDPVVTIDYPTNANTGDSNFLYSTVDATGTASDINLDTVEVQVDSEAPATPAGTGSWSYSWDTAAYPLAKNGTDFKVTATDLAGNTGTATVTVHVRPKITGISVNTEVINQPITINGFNFDTTASVDVIFKAGGATVTSNTAAADSNTINVTIPATATSGDVYITEKSVDSNPIHLDLWEWKTVTVGNAAEQALALSGTDTYQAIYKGGGAKELWFSRNAGSAFVLEDGSLTTAPPASTSLGENPSIAVYDNAGTDVVHIAYIDKDGSDLYFIKSIATLLEDYTDFDDSVLVVSDAITRTMTSIAYDPGTPATIGITYQSDTGDLMYVESTDSGAAWGTPEVVDTGTGLYSSLAFDSSGTPCIAYYDETNSQIKFAYYTGSFWAADLIESTPFQGEYTSIKIDSNDGIHVSYYDGGSGDLKYAFASGRTAAFSVTMIDSIGITGVRTAISLDESGAEPLPHISYINNNYLTVRYAYYDGAAWNLLITPASIGTASPAATGIAVGSDGNIYLGYVDGNNAYQIIYRP